ncbi:MAG: hypothetical protein JMM74_02865 [Candidatus Xiphinematobacter sp.]|nr:MAG: hypothetical protein JMM78_02915 [Candidatus Xiphinematobacter sp.]QQY10417.1 MAG: hypothetical protein JMM74_02865 [Candidatus Xiphinematobacter sp.]QQY11150.1 MAG: hypothetical protein JMM77_02930 [Candidatus Xiphinematobacter sp.]
MTPLFGEDGVGVGSAPEPIFIFFTELADRIHRECTGSERKRVLQLLEHWRQEQAEARSTDPSQGQLIKQAIDLAIEITKNAFIPPCARDE